jgi:5-methyltetrahydrofolate--homocysteine methyltransferase
LNVIKRPHIDGMGIIGDYFSSGKNVLAASSTKRTSHEEGSQPLVPFREAEKAAAGGAGTVNYN